MNPFEPTPSTLYLDYLLARYCAGEATPEEYAQLQEYIADDPGLAALVEKQRAEFAAVFPDFQQEKAAGLARLQQAIGKPTTKPAPFAVFIDKVKETVSGLADDARRFVTAFCDADELILARAGALSSSPRMQVVKRVDGIVIKMVSDSGGLGISASSAQSADRDAVIEIGYGPLEDALLRDLETRPEPNPPSHRQRKIIENNGTEVEIIVLSKLTLKPGKADATRFTDAAQVSRDTFNLLKRGTYFVTVARKPKD